MAQAFMITNRKVTDGDLTYLPDLRDLHYFVSDKTRDKLAKLDNWTSKTRDEFHALLLAQTANFPKLTEEKSAGQQHVTFFIHGYNNSWQEAAKRYGQIKADLYDGPKGLGVPILFTWPSDGTAAGYLPDREDARASAPQIADLFVMLHDHLITMQRAAAINKVRNGSVEGNKQTSVCTAKISVIAHSMGNFVMQNALATASKKLNNPQLVSLIHQMVMVAADVDNDIFQKDKPGDTEGALMANLCYRVSALYTGLDQVLGASAGLKHFGTRRLGRSGLADDKNVWDNVCEFDVTPLVTGIPGTHSAVFESPKAMALLRAILQGTDRKVIVDSGALNP
jgi:esterase/lipase superfamily enzyme